MKRQSRKINLLNTKQMKSTVTFIILLAALMLTTGCATLFSGTTQQVTIESDPPGAQIVIDGKIEGNTPGKVKLHRELNDLVNGGKNIELVLPGYYRDGYFLQANLNSTAIINLFNIFFWGVDAATGAITKYDKYTNFMLMPVSGKTNNSNSELSEDKYEKLNKLKKLLDDGAITLEEYEKEKLIILEKK